MVEQETGKEKDPIKYSKTGDYVATFVVNNIQIFRCLCSFKFWEGRFISTGVIVAAFLRIVLKYIFDTGVWVI